MKKAIQPFPIALQIGEDVFQKSELLNKRLRNMAPFGGIDDVLQMFRECLPAAGTTCATEAVLWAVRSAILIADIQIKERDHLLRFVAALAVEVDSLHIQPGKA